MEFLNYFVQLYKGKYNLLTHLTLFSMCGLAVVCGNNVLSYKIGTWYGSYFGFSSSNDFVISICALTSIMLFLFIPSYGFVYANHLQNSDDNNLPSLSLNAYIVMLKVLPVLCLWTLYGFVAYLLSAYVINLGHLAFVVYNILMLLLLPFATTVLIKFSADFKYSADILNPFLAFKKVDFHLYKLYLFALMISILILGLFFLCINIVKNSVIFSDIYRVLGIKILGLCIFYYFLNVIYLAYIKGVVSIIKDKK